MASFIQSLYRRMRFGEPIVVVSGLPRSGTSMAMKMIEAGGIEAVSDGLREADIDNPKGYFEFEPVKDLARSADKSWLRDARGKVVKIISHLLRELPPEHNYRVVFMNRHLDEVLASQQKMLTHRDEESHTEDERMKELFGDDLWRARYALRKRPWFESIELDYSGVVADPEAAARQINRFLGGALDVEKMAEAVDPDLYRNRAKTGD
jgi:hypothetical protein